MFRKKIKLFIISVFLLFFIIKLNIVFAATPLISPEKTQIKDQTLQFQVNSGYPDQNATSIDQIIGKVIQIFLSLLGIIFLALIILGGYHWMTAQGEEEKVKKATGTIKTATIGLIIIIAAYAITYYVFQRIEFKANNNSSSSSAPS